MTETGHIARTHLLRERQRRFWQGCPDHQPLASTQTHSALTIDNSFGPWTEAATRNGVNRQAPVTLILAYHLINQIPTPELKLFDILRVAVLV